MLNDPSKEQTRTGHRGTGIWWGYVVTVVALAAILLLVLQNGHEVRFEWLWLDFDASLAVMLLATALLTMLATSLAGLAWRSHRRHVLDREPTDAREPGAQGEARPDSVRAR